MADPSSAISRSCINISSVLLSDLRSIMKSRTSNSTLPGLCTQCILWSHCFTWVNFTGAAKPHQGFKYISFLTPPPSCHPFIFIHDGLGTWVTTKTEHVHLISSKKLQKILILHFKTYSVQKNTLFGKVGQNSWEKVTVLVKRNINHGSMLVSFLGHEIIKAE